MLKSSFPDDVKVNITIDDTRLRLSLSKMKQLDYLKNLLYNFRFYSKPYGPLSDIEGFLQLIPGTYKSDKPTNFTGVDRVHFKTDCINGSIVNGVSEPILYSFALSSPTGHKIYEKP